jgi:pimeloyl-ACP methyl ester carboxylesterase
MMETRHLVSGDGLPLICYRAGTGAECVVIANAPGMSIRFWAPVIAELAPAYTVIGFEYRGYPDAPAVLTDAQLGFDHFVADLRLVLKAEGVERAHLVSWCLGGKLTWEFQRRYPEAVASLLSFGMACGHADQPDSAFSRALYGIRARIAADPGSTKSMITMMKQIGMVPEPEFFETIFKEDEDGPVLSLMDLLEAESSMSSLAYYLLDDPVGLQSYLGMYAEFRRVPVLVELDRLRIPVTLVVGTEDRMTPLLPEHRAALAAVPELRVEEVEGASHFLPIELPRRTARLITAHLERAAAPALAAAS